MSANSKRGKSGLKVTQTLPEPKISGSTATYPDAVAPGADLVVQAQADGFVSQVVFRQRPTGPVTVRLPLTLPEGTTFGKTPEGLPQLKNAKGKAAAAPIALTAMDAKMEASPEEGKSSAVDARVEITGKSSELVFTPDEKFLANPAVTYPVTIAAASEWFGGGEPTDAWVSKNTVGNNSTAKGCHGIRDPHFDGIIDADMPTFAQYARHNYATRARRRPHPAPGLSGRGGATRFFILRHLPLDRVTRRVLREWVEWMLTKPSARNEHQPSRPLSDEQAARRWAQGRDITVKKTGRVPPGVLRQWREAGSPQTRTTKPEDALAGHRGTDLPRRDQASPPSRHATGRGR
ncbi:hypothetical protein E1295_38560 [Nonomuraea mesophila]|uniref:Uncharacterized protein n=1 Tax=Nonomuraea mesophila TaxID=2530382 RepID=A0A4R5EFH4_9ACTN|nr:hypothetical protein [Nonomuraea mesophila]TDE33135.1 hypothetical protein E1295_38560 [Nonomuraea mesophila]